MRVIAKPLGPDMSVRLWRDGGCLLRVTAGSLLPNRVLFAGEDIVHGTNASVNGVCSVNIDHNTNHWLYLPYTTLEKLSLPFPKRLPTQVAGRGLVKHTGRWRCPNRCPVRAQHSLSELAQGVSDTGFGANEVLT